MLQVFWNIFRIYSYVYRPTFLLKSQEVLSLLRMWDNIHNLSKSFCQTYQIIVILKLYSQLKFKGLELSDCN